MDMTKTDVLIYYTEDCSEICSRSSGTEPKNKFYISVNAQLDCIENFTKIASHLNEKIKNITLQFQFY